MSIICVLSVESVGICWEVGDPLPRVLEVEEEKTRLRTKLLKILTFLHMPSESPLVSPTNNEWNVGAQA